MQLGTYIDGRALEYDERTGAFSVGGTPITRDQLIGCDDYGQIMWASVEFRERARGYGTASPVQAGHAPAPGAVFGYRTKTWWKMAIASLYYGVCALLLIGVFQPDQYSIRTFDVVVGIAANVVLWLAMILPAIVFSETKYRLRMPLFRRRRFWANALGLALCWVLAFAAIGSADALHSSEYRAAKVQQQALQAEAETAEKNAQTEAQRLARAKAADEEQAARARAASEAAAAAEAAKAPAETVPQKPVVALTSAVVVRVVDGDTAVFRLNGGAEEKVRFIGVDTPESTNEIEPYGKEASAYTKRVLAVGKTVYLEEDAEERDRYGRLLAYVWLEPPTELSDAELRDKLFNARLAIDGYAQQMTIAPNVKYADQIGAFVAEARSADRGLWDPALVATPEPPAPKPAAKPAPTPGASYIGNRNTKKFHYADCGSVGQMNPANKVPLSSREEAISQGYVPCKNCDP